MRRFLVIALLCASAFAQTFTLAPVPKLQFLDSNGQPLAGGLIYTYAAGTTTPLVTYTDSTGLVPNTNPVVLDSGGFGAIWLSPAKYKFIIADQNSVTQYTVDQISSTNLPITGTVSFSPQAAPTCVSGNYILWADSGSSFIKMCNNGTVDTVVGTASTQTLTNKTLTSPAITNATATTTTLNNVQTVQTFTDAGIQAAINAAPDGGEVYLPAGTYIACSNLPLIIGNKTLYFHGAGMRGSIIQVCSSASGTTDVLSLKPSTLTAIQGSHFSDFSIVAQSGTPARHGIVFDGTNGVVSNIEIDHIWIGQLGSTAIATINSGSQATGNPFTTTIHDSVLIGGLDLTNGGDNIAVKQNLFTGTGAILISLVQGASDGGPHGFLFSNNNVTLSGMFQVTNAWVGVIENNNIEQTVANTEPNGCIIDVIGNTGTAGPIQNLVIKNNYIGTNSVCGVRVDHGKGIQIIGNYMTIGSSGAILLTANADRTYFGYNRMAPDNAINSFLSDSGTNTSGDYIDQGTGLVSHYGAHIYQTAAGVSGTAITNAQIKINSTNGIFCATSGSATTSCDTALWRGGANQWAMGNAYGDSTGSLALGGIKVGSSGSTITDTRELLQSVHSCGTTTTCANTANGSYRAVIGTVTLSAGSAVVGSMTAFTSTSSYVCTGTDQTAAAAVKIANTSTTSITITGTSTDVIGYHCIGN